MASLPIVTNDVAASRFEAPTEHGTAMLRYAARGDVLDLIHTVVPQEAEGQGIGASLARAALEYARANDLKVIASCPFVRAYLQRHKEYADLVATG
jgi:predicted GNAT family acetyltransferase